MKIFFQGTGIRSAAASARYFRRWTASLFDVLQRVLDTGEPFTASDYPVSLDRDGDGVPETYYFNFVYHPLKETAGDVTGVVGIGTEVTESVRARKAAEELRRACGRCA